MKYRTNYSYNTGIIQNIFRISIKIQEKQEIYHSLESYTFLIMISLFHRRQIKPKINKTSLIKSIKYLSIYNNLYTPLRQSRGKSRRVAKS